VSAYTSPDPSQMIDMLMVEDHLVHRELVANVLKGEAPFFHTI